MMFEAGKSRNKMTFQQVDDDIAQYLRKKGITSEGSRYLRAAHILMEADVLDQLLLMYNKGQQEKLGSLGIIERAAAVTRLIESGGDLEIPDVNVTTSQEKKPEPEEDEDPAPAFGA